MKKTIIICVLTIFSTISFGQQYQKTVKEINDESVVKLLGSIDTFFIKKADRFLMRFFRVSNGSGSANIPGGHEISKNVVISVSEYDEYPIYKVFTVGPFYAPKFAAAGTDLKDRYIMNVEHGAAGRRQITKLTVYLDKVLIE